MTGVLALIALILLVLKLTAVPTLAWWVVLTPVGGIVVLYVGALLFGWWVIFGRDRDRW